MFFKQVKQLALHASSIILKVVRKMDGKTLRLNQDWSAPFDCSKQDTACNGSRARKEGDAQEVFEKWIIQTEPNGGELRYRKV